jgi:ketosteroid isomerase-like protein
MYHWLVDKQVRRVVAKSRAGDMSATLALWADDGHFQFPGRSSWTADLHSTDEIGVWYERFARVGLQLHPEEILVKGWPWRTTACVHFTDTATDPSGTVVYENRGVLFVRMRWGKITYGTVYEDTQKVADFDEYLAVHEPATA